jgi:hypothetical protein
MSRGVRIATPKNRANGVGSKMSVVLFVDDDSFIHFITRAASL